MNNLLYSLKEELASKLQKTAEYNYSGRLQKYCRVIICGQPTVGLLTKTQWCTCRLAHMGPIAVIPFGLQEGFLLKTHGGPMMGA